MTDNVLVLAPAEDSHAAAVAIVLAQQFDVLVDRWDTDGLPAADTAAFRIDGRQPEFRIRREHGRIDWNRLRSIWWRRPSRFAIREEVEEQRVRAFCWRECETFFKGAVDAIGVPIINRPAAENAARKPLQLAYAHELGLRVPRTLMTNDPREVRNFWHELGGNCIYKGFTAPAWRMAETRPLTETALHGLETLRHAPILVQERIEKSADVRVSIFGDEVFAGKVEVRLAAAELDWRLDLTATWKPHNVPEEVSDRLRALLRRLGLHYGSFDLVVGPGDEYVFLEVNPSGQFLFLEIDTGQPLTRACAAMLANP